MCWSNCWSESRVDCLTTSFSSMSKAQSPPELRHSCSLNYFKTTFLRLRAGCCRSTHPVSTQQHQHSSGVRLTVPAVWCWAGSLLWLYQGFFSAVNSCQLCVEGSSWKERRDYAKIWSVQLPESSSLWAASSTLHTVVSGTVHQKAKSAALQNNRNQTSGSSGGSRCISICSQHTSDCF